MWEPKLTLNRKKVIRHSCCYVKLSGHSRYAAYEPNFEIEVFGPIIYLEYLRAGERSMVTLILRLRDNGQQFSCPAIPNFQRGPIRPPFQVANNRRIRSVDCCLFRFFYESRNAVKSGELLDNNLYRCRGYSGAVRKGITRVIIYRGSVQNAISITLTC